MNESCNTPRCQRGFTILEVLVAFLVAALLLSVILTGFSSGMKQLVRADRLSQASLVAQSRMAEVGVVQQLQEAQFSGHDGQFSDFSWEVNIAPFSWEFAAPLAGMGGTLYRIDVEVSWPAAGKVHSFSLSSLRLGQDQRL